jgi:hypothetical protein
MTSRDSNSSRSRLPWLLSLTLSWIDSEKRNSILWRTELRNHKTSYVKTLWKPVALWWADLVSHTTGDVIKSDMWHNVESVYCYYYLSLLHTVRETNGLGAYVLKNASGTVSDVISCRHMYINYFWFWQRCLEFVTPRSPQHEGLSFTLGSTFHTAETQWRFCYECERGDKTRDELYHHIIFRAMSKLRGKIVDV